MFSLVPTLLTLLGTAQDLGITVKVFTATQKWSTGEKETFHTVVSALTQVTPKSRASPEQEIQPHTGFWQKVFPEGTLMNCIACCQVKVDS